MNQSMKSHRGVLILVLGILGLLVCPIFGPIAWIMGKGDLAEMDAGQMDPEGRGLTQAGWICGIIGSIFIILGILGGIAVVVFGAGAAALESGSY